MKVEFVRVVNIPNAWISRSRRFKVYPSNQYPNKYVLWDSLKNQLHYGDDEMDAFFKAETIMEAKQ